MAPRESSADARKRLVQAGIEIFAAYGYSAATTRMLTDSAGVNLSAIPYYFGTKEELYREVITHITTYLKTRMSPVLEKMDEAIEKGNMSPEEAIASIRQLMGAMVEVICGTSHADCYARIIFREQMNPSPAFDIIYRQFMNPMLDRLTVLISVITGEQDRRKAALRVFSLLGQMIVFRASKETIVRYLDMEGYSQDEMMEIREMVTAGAVDFLKAIGKNGGKEKGGP